MPALGRQQYKQGSVPEAQRRANQQATALVMRASGDRDQKALLGSERDLVPRQGHKISKGGLSLRPSF